MHKPSTSFNGSLPIYSTNASSATSRQLVLVRHILQYTIAVSHTSMLGQLYLYIGLETVYIKFMLDDVILLSHMGAVPDQIPLAWHSRDDVPLRL